MKTALKLNKKQLFELYEKSSDLVKANLRMEFGKGFFMPEVTPVIDLPAIKNTESKKMVNKAWNIDWKAMFDFTTILRIAIYVGLICILF